MANSPSNIEKKAVIRPDHLARILLSSLQGKAVALEGERRRAVEHMLAEFGISEMTFPTGDEGVAAKRAFSDEGGVIVQTGIVLTRQLRNIVIHERMGESPDGSGHRVVTGSSILLSGDARKDPREILSQKLIIDGERSPEGPELIGLSVSDPKVSKGINYLFKVFREQLGDLCTVTSKTADRARITSRGQARKDVGNKHMEHAVLSLLSGRP